MIQKLLAIFERIKQTSSRTEKENILREFQNDDDFRTVVNFLYNDFITTGLAQKKIRKTVCCLPKLTTKNLFEILEYLKNNNTGADENVATVQYFIDSVVGNEQERQFLEELFTKTYSCGITAKTVNKAFGETFVPEYAVQLAHPFEKYSNRITGEFVITNKLDGHRTTAIVDKYGNATFFTRKGKPIERLNDLSNDIYDFANNSGILGRVEYNNGFVLDGELLVLDEAIDKKDVFQATSKIVRADGEKKNVALHVFDLVPLSEFQKGQSTATYLIRRQVLEQVFSKKEYDNLKLVPIIYQGTDISIIPDLLKYAESQGEEGLMLNTDDVYVTKRTASLLKVKSFLSADLEVVDAYEGTGKYVGKLGGVIVEYNGENVSVGSGFTDEEREGFWSNKDDLIGKIIEVQYFSESNNSKDDKISLRFPTFKSIRYDKSIEDVNIDN